MPTCNTHRAPSALNDLHKRPLAYVASAGLLLLGLAFLTPAKHVRAAADSKAEGAELFASSGCAHCHGAVAQGTDKGPTLRNVSRKMTAEKMHKQIAEGGASMPAFGDSLDSAQIDKLIDTLRDKHPEKLLAAHPAKP